MENCEINEDMATKILAKIETDEVGVMDIESDVYRKIDALCNSDLQLIEGSPSNYVWAKNAPSDESKKSALDYGTALHAALIEPHTLNSIVDVYTDTKTRETVKFQKYLDENQEQGKLILLESEYDKLRFTVDGAQYHPRFAELIGGATHKEGSIVTDFMGLKVKIRPDAMRVVEGEEILLCDVKSTALISDWRSDTKWKNPIFDHNYGFTAAFYMDVASAHFGVEINEYKFLVVQKTIEMGRYPVAVIKITREELEMYGFFERVYNAIDRYKECKESSNWSSEESLPEFYVPFDDTVDVSFGE